MAYTAINKSTDYFNTKLYTANNSSSLAITGVGHQPDFVWVKNRNSDASHILMDAVRGVTKHLVASSNAGEVTSSAYMASFDNDGFTLNNDADVNGLSRTYASWNWKAGTTGSGTSTGSGTGKAYSYSVSTTSGFSIVKYVGNGTAGHTIPHHLGQAPTFTIVKALGLTESWQVISSGLAADKFIQLNANSAEVSQGSYNRFNSTRPSSTVVTLGSDDHTNKNDNNFIMYNFCNVDGFSKSGSYNGNGNADGPFVYTGFKPAFIIIKRTDASGDWQLVDNKRDIDNPTNKTLFPNLANAEDAGDRCDIVSNGFKILSSTGTWNASANKYIYMSFGQSLIGSNNVPCTSR